MESLGVTIAIRADFNSDTDIFATYFIKTDKENGSVMRVFSYVIRLDADISGFANNPKYVIGHRNLWCKRFKFRLLGILIVSFNY